MWRPCGRESGGAFPQAARPHGRLPAVTQGRALRALAASQPSLLRCPARRKDTDVATTLNGWRGCCVSSLSRPRSGRARSAKPCVTARKRPKGRAACGEHTPRSSRPKGRHFGSRNVTIYEVDLPFSLYSYWQQGVADNDATSSSCQQQLFAEKNTICFPHKLGSQDAFARVHVHYFASVLP